MKIRFQPSTLFLFLLWETEVRCAVQTGSDSKRMLRHSSSKERQLEEPVLQIVGDTGFFGYGKGFSIYPLEQCMGDCDDDDDCAEGLVCFVRQPYKSVPGCQDVGEFRRKHRQLIYCVPGFRYLNFAFSCLFLIRTKLCQRC